MAKFETDGFAGVTTDMVKSINDKTKPALKAGLYDGAGTFADELRREVQNLPTDYGYVNLKSENPRRLTGLLPKQKDGLLKGLGIADFKTEHGAIVTEIGFTGYNDLRTKKYPNGQPNALIARSLVKGTSIFEPNKFVNRAYKRAKGIAENKMVETITRILTPDHK